MQKANVNLIEQEDLLYQQDSLIPKKAKSNADNEDYKELEEELDKKDQNVLTVLNNQETRNESTNLECITNISQLSESKSQTNEYIIDPKPREQTLQKKPKKTSPPKNRVQTNKKKEELTLEEKVNEEMNKTLKIYRNANDNQFGNILNESIEKNIDGKYSEKKEIRKIIEEQPITAKYEDYNYMQKEDEKFEDIQSIYENQRMNLLGKRDYLEEYDFFADDEDDPNREIIYNFTEKNYFEHNDLIY